MRVTWCVRAAAVLAAAAAVGCGDEGARPSGAVGGAVTFAGQPVTTGVINFVSKKGVGAQAKIGPDGRFRIDGVIEAGEYRAFITPTPPEPQPPGSPPAPPAKLALPAKFRDPSTSGVRVIVNGGTNEFPVNLRE